LCCRSQTRLINFAQEAAMSVVLNQIAQIAINVHDLPRAVAFYRDVLGMHHLFDAGSRLSFFACGGIRLMLSLPEKPEFDHPASVLYYMVADLQLTYEGLAASGVKFEQKPTLVAPMPDHDLWMAFFRDSENNPLALMAEVRKAK
jgi:catechol 2,3-dioxygenase-like lactoylglutathione lyase family enzyme